MTIDHIRDFKITLQVDIQVYLLTVLQESTQTTRRLQSIATSGGTLTTSQTLGR